jgi:hypothetical protein
MMAGPEHHWSTRKDRTSGRTIGAHTKTACLTATETTGWTEPQAKDAGWHQQLGTV